ncbi:MAG TPA: hydantoinase/oxoprolinase family protein [Candidatus Sulfomarinibacteraceae bacterium]|nr:hydantoinase/oxoprolinase family protein [Candidatus Sulfomarinibacteraceae bacterium]
MSKYRVSADIGGTFTDFVVMDETEQTVFIGKVPTTTDNPARGVLQGLGQLTPDQRDIEFMVHGTTVGLNAFLERKGSRVLLIMTEGLRDAYSIARGDRKELYELQYRKPERLVPRRDVHEVRERIRWDGSVLTPLHEEDFAPIIQKVRDEGIDAIAVCFIHAFAYPEHELRAREILCEALPGVSVTLSHEIAREWREYERASSAVMNAYVAPIVSRYLASLEGELRQRGVDITLHVMQSSGGVMTVDTARDQPVYTLLSGPVGGTIGGIALSKMLDRPNLLCVDMGGTSFDVSLVIDGEPTLTSETELEGLPLLMPIVNIHTVGAGGGSIAWLEAGAMRVGPKSAGAQPGPVCYGRGGTQPTVTDANLFLRRLGAGSLLGGDMPLDEEASAQAIAKMAAKVGLDEVAFAEGILAITNAKMADAMRTITVEQGIDPRDFSLVAFGGAGPMQAIWLAQELEIGEVIIPRFPGTFSAWGMLHTDVRHDLTRNFYEPAGAVQAGELEAVYDELQTRGAAILLQENVAPEDNYFLRSADMRYIGQEYTVNVPINGDIDPAGIVDTFHQAHKRRYGHATPDAPVEFVNLRLAAMGRLPKATSAYQVEAQGDPQRGARQAVFDGQAHETPILWRDALEPGSRVQSPVIIEEKSATTVIPPGYVVRVDPSGNLIITVE